MVWIKSWRYSGFCGIRGERQSSAVRTWCLRSHLLKLPIIRSNELLLQEANNFLDCPTRDHLEGDAESFSPHVHVWTGQHAQNVHDEFVEDVFMFRMEELHARENNHLDVV